MKCMTGIRTELRRGLRTGLRYTFPGVWTNVAGMSAGLLLVEA